MSFDATITHNSESVPGVTFTVRRMGFGRRTQLDLKTLALRQRLRELQADYPALSDKEKELQEQADIARRKVLAVPDAEVQAVIDNELKPLLAAVHDAVAPGVRKHRAVLDEEYGDIESRIRVFWIEDGLISITGGGLDGMTAAELLDHGPPQLAIDIYDALAKDGRLRGPDAKNLQSPGTSGGQVDGLSQNIIALDAAAPLAAGI